MAPKLGGKLEEVKEYHKAYVVVPWDKTWKSGGKKHERYKSELERDGIEILNIGEVIRKAIETAGNEMSERSESLWMVRMAWTLERMGVLSLNEA
jgi:hypothetical protein